MNRTPLIVSYSLIASLSLFYIGTSLSDAQAQQNSAEKSKVLKSKTAKAKPYRTRAHQPQATPAAVKAMPASPTLTAATLTAAPAVAEPLKLAVTESLNTFPTAPVSTQINPYFANQPAAILPKAVQPFLPVQAANPQPEVAPVQVAIAPPAMPTPVVSAPMVAAPVVAPPVAFAPPAAFAPPTAFTPPVSAYQPANFRSNPYLAYQYQSTPAPQVMATMDLTPKIYSPVTAAPVTVAPVAATPIVKPAVSFAPQDQLAKWAGNLPTGWLPSLPFQTSTAAPSFFRAATPTSAAAPNNTNTLLSNLKMMIPLTGDADILPTIKKVYPTGEKPLVVINFKCPTELIGITPPPMKLLHEALNLGFDGLNKTNMLSFNLQQVCS